MKYKDLNENIIKLIGGKENIKSVAHCVTRLRFTLNDRSIAQTEEIKKLKGVIDVVSNDVASFISKIYWCAPRTITSVKIHSRMVLKPPVL